MKKFATAIPVLFLMLLASCSDSTTPSTTGNYLPKTVGSYLIYENYIIDSTNQRQNASSPVLDSAVITGVETKLGQSATVYQHYTNTNNSGYVLGNKWYFYSESENVYVYSGLFNEIIGFDKYPVKLPFTIEEKWMKLYDAQNSTWNLHTKTINNDTIDYNGLKIPFSGTFKIDASKQSKEDMTINGKKLSCQKIDYTFKIEGLIKYLIYEIPVPISGVCSMWFADNVGLVKVYLPSQRIKIATFIDQYMNGTEQTLIRYNIK